MHRSYHREMPPDLIESPNYQLSKFRLKRQEHRYFQRLYWLFIVILVIASVYLFDQRPAYLSSSKALLALGITWCGFFPSLQYLADRQRPPMPFFPLIGFFYATSFGLPMFSGNKDLSKGAPFEDVSHQALMLTFLGVIGMTVAFYASRATLWKTIKSLQLPKSYPQNTLLFLLWICLLSHMAYIFVPAVREIPSLNQLLDPIGYIAYGMFYVLRSRGKLPLPQALILLLIFVPIEVIQRFITGALAQLLTIGMFMILVVWHERKRVPLLLITIGIMFFLIFNSAKSDYRQLAVKDEQFARKNPLEKAGAFIEIAVNQYQNHGSGSKDSAPDNSSVDGAISRTAHIILFSQIVEETPDIVPYWNGETYSSLFTSFIPRALWPEKPTAAVGNTFGQRYNLLGKHDETTSVNLPWIVEMYANFGVLGVLAGMPCLGLLTALIDRKLNNPAMNSLEFIIGTTTILQLFYQESNFSLMVGAVIPLSITLYILFGVFLSKGLFKE